MTRLFLIICTAALPLLAFADDQTKWGEPINGLRIGIVNPPMTVTSDQRVTFKIEAQNVSQQPISLPTPETFVLKRSPQSDDYHESPLIPVVEKTRLAPPSDQPESAWSMSASGVIVDKDHKAVVSIAPGQSVTWESVGLEKQYYYGDRVQAGCKATVQRWFLLPGYLFHIRFRFENEEKQFAGSSVWIGQADSGVTDVKVDAPSTAGIRLEGGFTLPKQNYFLGEAIKATFTVTNKGDTSIRFPTGGDYSYSGRHGRYSILAVDERGQAVPDPVPNPGGGGIGGDTLVEAGASYTEDMLVNQWCALSKPGKYRITLKRTLNVIRPDPPEPDFWRKPESSLPAVSIETTLDVTIEDNPSALKAYLAALSNIVGLTSASSGNNPASGPTFDLLKSEAQARMPAAFPEIVKLLDGSPGIQLQAVQCLAYYGNEKAAPVLLEHAAKLAPWSRESALRTLSEWNATEVEPLVAAALRDKDNELRANTVLICSNRWYGSCVPILLTMGNDPNPLVRRYLGAALGASGDPQAIPVLLKLLHDSDPDPFIKIWAADGLGKFKRMEGVPVMIALLRDSKVRDDEGNVMETLKDLTGHDLNDNRKTYLDWWEKAGRAEYEKH